MVPNRKSTFYVTGVPEEEEKEVKAEKVFIEIMLEKLLHLTTNITYRFKKLSKFQIGLTQRHSCGKFFKRWEYQTT